MNRSTTIPSGEGAESAHRDPSTTFLGDGFTLALGDEWTNETVYRMEGPTADGYTHVLKVNVNTEVEDILVVDYATLQVDQQLKGLEDGRLVDTTRTKLENELVASRVLLECGDQRPWTYQEDWYIVHQKVGYRLSARFTETTLDTIGPQVEEIFRSFEPRSPLVHRR